MQNNKSVLSVFFLLLLLIIACTQPAPTSSTEPITVEGVHYNASDQTLTLTLSDGKTIGTDLTPLVTEAELTGLSGDAHQPAQPASISLVGASFDADSQTLSLTLSDGSTIDADLNGLITSSELTVGFAGLQAAMAHASATVRDASYDAGTGMLTLAMSDGTNVQADLGDLTTNAEITEALLSNAELLAALSAAQLTPAPRRPPTVVDASFSRSAQTLILTLSDGSTIKVDLNTLITTSELAAAIAAIPVTPTPVPTPRPTPIWWVADDMLDVGMANLGPYVATNYDAGFFQNRFAELVTHETLFVMGYDGEWEHRLVKSFDISPDALTYTLHLQPGVKWHAGAQSQGDWGDFNADDFIWSISEIAREGSKHVQAGNTRRLFRCPDASRRDQCRLTKIDDLTVELKRPEPTFRLTWFSQAPIPGFSMNSKKHYDVVGQDVALLEDVGTGPWEMVEHVTDVRRHMKAVEDHWRKVPEFAEMIWHDIPNESTRLANFLSGQLDTGIFNADSRQAIRRAISAGTHPDVKFMTFPAAIIQMLWHEGLHYTPGSAVGIDGFFGDYRNICDDSEIVNGVATEMSSSHRRPWISCNPSPVSAEWERARKVREAMLRGIDRQALINNIAFGEGEPWFIGMWANRGRMEQLGLDTLGPGDMDYDPVAAKELLAEAGYPDGFAVQLNKRLGTGTLLLVKDAVATDWLELGLDVSLQNQQPAAYRVTSQARKVNNIYGLNDPPSFPEPLRQYSFAYKSTGTNPFGVNHPTIDGFIEASENELDTDARWRIQGVLARFIYENVLSMPLYAENAAWPLGPEVDSWQASPAELDWLSYWEYARRRQ